MKELDKTYNPSEIEGRIYDKWMEKKYFHAEVNRDKKPFTIDEIFCLGCAGKID